MIVDTSALIAILARESARETLVDALLREARARMSAANYLECAIVVDRRDDPVLARSLDPLLDRLGITIVDVDLRQARIAQAAYRDFGRGSGHAAGLNFGDCFAYALASSSGEPLLFIGDDFGHTDITPALG